MLFSFSFSLAQTVIVTDLNFMYFFLHVLNLYFSKSKGKFNLLIYCNNNFLKAEKYLIFNLRFKSNFLNPLTKLANALGKSPYAVKRKRGPLIHMR